MTRLPDPQPRRDLAHITEDGVTNYIAFLERIAKKVPKSSPMGGVIKGWIERAWASSDPEGSFYA